MSDTGRLCDNCVMLTGLNHITLATRDLARSLDFYTRLLGFCPHAVWDAGAYLTLDGMWLCLSLDPVRAQEPQADYTHYAFSISHGRFDDFAALLRENGVREWKQNSSEGESLYFLDPDGHKLEAHVGDLASRLAQCRTEPYAGMRFYETSPT